MMNSTMDMMKGAMSSSDMPMKDMDPMMMQEALEALTACTQACIMCADADAGAYDRRLGLRIVDDTVDLAVPVIA